LSYRPKVDQLGHDTPNLKVRYLKRTPIVIETTN